MSRASNPELVEPFEEPEREFNRLRKAARERERLRRMADNLANMSLEEYASRTREGNAAGIQRPEIPEQTNFEIKGQFLHILRETPFTGKDHEDANQHVEAVLEIADYFHIPGVTKDAVMLRVFPITLQGAAKRWLRSEPTIRTWEVLKTKFIKQFSPPSKIAKMKMQIQNFVQLEDETLYDAWDRYKEMLQNCPQHDLNPHQVVQTFYNGINVCTRQMVDSQGPIPKKTPTQGYAIIEELAQHSHQWHSSRDSSAYRKGSSTTTNFDGLAALNAKLDALGRDVKKVQQDMCAMQVGCEYCGGPHLKKDCSYDENGNPKESACLVYDNGYNAPNDERRAPHHPYQNRPWKPYPEYRKEMEGKYKQQGPGIFRRDQPKEPEKKSDFEDMLSRFAAASEQRHKETEELVKRIGSSTEAALRNQQASIHNIETQVGQISRVLQDRFPGTLPSNTEPNPKAAINAVSTRSGKTLTDPLPSSSTPNVQSSQQPEQRVEMEVPPKHSAQSSAPPPGPSSAPPPVPPYRPPIPYPQRLRKDEQDEQYRKFLEHLKSLHINIPFVEAMAQMPKYAKFMKDLLTNRKKLEAVSSVTLNDQCSAAMLNKIPKKMTDPGSLTLPCQFGNLPVSHALADSGASVNLMPYSFFAKLGLPEPKPIRMAIHLANKSVTYPRGIVEDLLVKVDKFIFPVDFIVIDMEEDDKVPIILGRPFLSTARALFDIHESQLTLRVGTDAVTFGLNHAMRYSKSCDDSAFFVDIFDTMVEDELRGTNEKEANGQMPLGEGLINPERDHEELVRILTEGQGTEPEEQDFLQSRRASR